MYTELNQLEEIENESPISFIPLFMAHIFFVYLEL